VNILAYIALFFFAAFAVFVVLAVRAGAIAEKRTNKIHEDEQAKRN